MLDLVVLVACLRIVLLCAAVACCSLAFVLHFVVLFHLGLAQYFFCLSVLLFLMCAWFGSVCVYSHESAQSVDFFFHPSSLVY